MSKKALLTFAILIDEGLGDVRTAVKLYRQDDGALVWRLRSERGERVGVLPTPATLDQAKRDALAAYPVGSVWGLEANWG